MTTPNPTEIVKSVTSALTIKNIITLAVLFVVISLIISYVMRNEITITDASGNKLTGETKPRLKFGFAKK